MTSARIEGGGDMKLSAMLASANNEFEARGMAQEWNERKYPTDDGWALANMIVLEMPETDELLEDGLTIVEPKSQN